MSDVFSAAAIEEALSALEEKKNSSGSDGLMLSELRSYWKINGASILDSLERETYEPGLVRITELLGRNGKRRKIALFNSLDRLLLRCLSQRLQEIVEPLLHENCYAFRAGQGVQAAVSRTASLIRGGYRWEARFDIRDYFDSIPLDKLQTQIERLPVERRLFRILARFLHIRTVTDGNIQTLKKGILQGSPLSPALGNLYLSPFDKWLDSKKLPFCRYSDDILVCFRTRAEAEDFYGKAVQELLQTYRLELNQKKSGVVEMDKQRFLGYTFQKERDGNVTAIRAESGRRSVNYDWQTEHIRKIDRNYHIINGGVLSRKDYNLLFENEEGKRYIPVETTGSLNLYANIIFSSSFFHFAGKKRLHIHFFDRYGHFVGSFAPAGSGFQTKTMLRQAEIYLDKENRLIVAKAIELAAFHNLRANLRYYAKLRGSVALDSGIHALSETISRMMDKKNMGEMLLEEARGRQIYYSMFNEILDNPEFRFTSRTRRPPQDPLNALISFGNTFLYQRIATEISKTALDIRIGFVHAANSRSQSLNLDIAELFKPLVVDRAIFTLVNKRMISAKRHFESVENGGIYLNHEGKRIFLNELDAKIYSTRAGDDHPSTYDTKIREEIRKLLHFVNGGDEYKPYKHY